MGTINGVDHLLSLVTGGSAQFIWFSKTKRFGGATVANPIQARFMTTWGQDGTRGGGANPTSAINPDNTTAGALKQADAGGSNQLWLVSLTVTGGVANGFILYDRLFQCGGLSAAITTSQTIGGAVTRYTGAESVGNQMWIEIHTSIGSSLRTLTVDYTNQDGNAAVTTTILGSGGYLEAKAILPVPFASGDTGARAITSIQLDATTGTAGDFAMLIARPLAFIPAASTGAHDSTDFMDQLVPVKNGACLALANYATDAGYNDVLGCAVLVEA